MTFQLLVFEIIEAYRGELPCVKADVKCDMLSYGQDWLQRFLISSGFSVLITRTFLDKNSASKMQGPQKKILLLVITIVSTPVPAQYSVLYFSIGHFLSDYGRTRRPFSPMIKMFL